MYMRGRLAGCVEINFEYNEAIVLVKFSKGLRTLSKHVDHQSRNKEN